jgi:hypothetical protein
VGVVSLYVAMTAQFPAVPHEIKGCSTTGLSEAFAGNVASTPVAQLPAVSVSSRTPEPESAL